MALSGFATVALGVLAPAQAQVGARPSAVSIHLDRCVAYYNRGNLSQAIAEVRKAQRLLPNDPDINFMLGNALYRSRDMRAAATAYGKVLGLRPTHFEARMSRGFALFEVEDFQGACGRMACGDAIGSQGTVCTSWVGRRSLRNRASRRCKGAICHGPGARWPLWRRGEPTA
jgi:Flp pilus assembly protein TadD